MINVDLIKNPVNWLVIMSMVLIGTTGFHLVATHIRNGKE